MPNAPLRRISKVRPEIARTAVPLALVLLLAAVAIHPAQAQTFTVLYNFKGSPDGANPYAGLLLDEAGNLYGTTYAGGSSKYGTVFKVNKAGKETVLHSLPEHFRTDRFPTEVWSGTRTEISTARPRRAALTAMDMEPCSR